MTREHFKNEQAIFLVGGLADTLPMISSGPVSRKVFSLLQNQQALDQYTFYCFSHSHMAPMFQRIQEFKQNPDRDVVIIAHSYGVDSVCYRLYPLLLAKNIKVKLLITLDGVGKLLHKCPSFLFKPSACIVDYWLNIYAKPDKKNISDFVASSAALLGGGRWLEIPHADLNYQVITNHDDTISMLLYKPDYQYMSALNHILSLSHGYRMS